VSETFPKWVVQRYCDLMNKQEGEHVHSPSMFGGAFGPATLVALRLIQTHEKEPVDHDVRAVATILHEYGGMDVNFYVEAFSVGDAEMLAAVEAYRAGKAR
jgi:hypothetical protein